VASLATALQCLLGIEIFVTLLSGLAHWHRRGLVERLQHGRRLTFDEMQSADDYVRVTSALFALLALAIFVVLLVFLWRAAKNTEVWQRQRPRRGAGWAIGAWFIPFVNLVLPAMVVHDVWRRSPSVDEYGYRHEESGALVVWWWLAWIASNLLQPITGSSDDSTSAAALRSADNWRSFGAAFAVAAAVLLIGVVRRLAARQSILARTGPAAATVPAPSSGTWTPRV
jgi:hypothetical protein